MFVHLGYRDFKPTWHDSDCSRNDESGFDDFECVVAEANAWAQSLPEDVKILNMHTLCTKAKFTRSE